MIHRLTRLAACAFATLGAIAINGGVAVASEYDHVIVSESSAVDVHTGESYAGRVPLVLEAGTAVRLSYTFLEPVPMPGSSHRLEAVLEPGPTEMYPAPFYGGIDGNVFEYEFTVPEGLKQDTDYRLTIRTAPGLGDTKNYRIDTFGFRTSSADVDDDLVQSWTESTTAPRPTLPTRPALPPTQEAEPKTKPVGVEDPHDKPAEENRRSGESERPSVRSSVPSLEDSAEHKVPTERRDKAGPTVEPSTAASYVSASGSEGQTPQWLWSVLLAAFGAGVGGLVVAAIVRRARRNASYRRLAARP